MPFLGGPDSAADHHTLPDSYSLVVVACIALCYSAQAPTQSWRTSPTARM
jgi:hypothetical protein